MEHPEIEPNADWGPMNQLLEAEEEEEEEDQVGNLRVNEDGSFDGGVATDIKGKSKASECDLILAFECTEEFDNFEDHPMLKVGVKVMIGMEKATKLFNVFSRYVEFCNEHANTEVATVSTNVLRLTNVEFIHCAVLDEHDTAESSALMKNDLIKVQHIRKGAREQLAEAKRMQTESDRIYFQQMRNLMPDFPSSSYADILFDCRGKTIGADGLNQEVLRTSVRAHSAILTKRCKWLDGLIRAARNDFDRRSVVSIPDHDIQAQSKEGEAARLRSFEDDDGIEPVLNYQVNQPSQQESGAAQIENDEEEEDSLSMTGTSRSGSPVFTTSIGNSTLLFVNIQHHTTDAVKLLLEYCYTNRVISLGRLAFEGASNPISGEENSPVPPISRKWPDGGKPKLSFSVALSGISIAEEAGIPRLSLMCEIAASLLIETTHDIVEALNLCTVQEKLTGNPLTKLRKSAMSLVLQRGPRGVTDMCRTPTFRRALDERRELLVPSLLHGTRELVQDEKKRDLSELSDLKYDELDREDRFNRELERRKYRGGCRKDPMLEEVESSIRSAFLDWVSPPQNKRTKRRHDSVRPSSGEARDHRILRRKPFGGASFV